MFLGPGGTGKSHLAQAIGQAAIQQGYKVLYRETHILLDELADAVADGTRKEYMESVATVPLLIIDDFGMRKLPHTAAEDLLEIIMRRYERFSTLLTSNRPVEDWGKLLGDVAAVSAMLDRLLHHGHVLKCGPRSWRTKTAAGAGEQLAAKEHSTVLNNNAVARIWTEAYRPQNTRSPAKYTGDLDDRFPCAQSSPEGRLLVASLRYRSVLYHSASCANALHTFSSKTHPSSRVGIGAGSTGKFSDGLRSCRCILVWKSQNAGR